MNDVTPPTRRWHGWGPWLLLAGFLLAALGGVTRFDCVLCTPSESLPVPAGSVLMLVGAAMWILRRDRPLARLLAVVLVTVIGRAGGRRAGVGARPRLGRGAPRAGRALDRVSG